MILDTIDNAQFYFNLSGFVKTGLEFLQNQKNLSGLPEGKIEIDGENVFALVQNYDTKDFDERRWEAHRKYFDIQFVVKGTEVIKVSQKSTMKPNTDYNSEGDYQLFTGHGSAIELTENQFILLSPEDVHQPGLMINNNPQSVKKIVLKVLIG